MHESYKYSLLFRKHRQPFLVGGSDVEYQHNCVQEIPIVFHVTSCFCEIGRKKISTDQSKEHVKLGRKFGGGGDILLFFILTSYGLWKCVQNAGNASSLSTVSRLRNTVIYGYVFTLQSSCRYSSFIIKPTRCTNITNLLWYKTLHVSDSSFAHHQEFIHCAISNGICHTSLYTAFEQDQDGPARKLSTNLYDIHHC
jgi:hypothetical protein